MPNVEQIPCVVTVTASDMELLLLAVERNSSHGQQLTQDEKRRYAVRWFDVLDPDKICAALSISRRTFSAWTQDKQKQREEEIRDRILSMHLRCHTQQQIADAVGVSQPVVARQIVEFIQNGKFSDSNIFFDFEGDGVSAWWRWTANCPPVQRDGICVNVAGRLKPALSRWIGPAVRRVLQTPWHPAR